MMDGATTSIEPLAASPRRVSRPVSPSDWVRPEFAVLQRRFDAWERELAGVSRTEVPGTALQDSIRQARHIADRIGGELQRFHRHDGPAAEPEDLRRLLGHGQRLTKQLTIRACALNEVRQTSLILAGACERLLHERTVDDEAVRRLCELLRENAASEDRPWVPADPAFPDVFAAAGNDRHGGATSRVVDVGVLASRFVARVARRLGLGRLETVAALYASLFQDCGYLLLHRCRGNRKEPSNHPRYGAALAAGLKRIPTESLAAIAGHHSDSFGEPGGRQRSTRRVDCLVWTVSRYVESYLLRTPQSPDGEEHSHGHDAAGSFRAEVLAALKAELARAVVPHAGPPQFVDGDSAPLHEFTGIVPAPRFLRSHSRTADRTAAVPRSAPRPYASDS
jgi:hypothetical protein